VVRPVLGLKAAFVVVPVILFGLSILFAWFSPITRRRQAIITRRLGQREARADRAMELDLAVSAEAFAARA
jgi:Na+/melibiose symporter-like transporter